MVHKHTVNNNKHTVNNYKLATHVNNNKYMSTITNTPSTITNRLWYTNTPSTITNRLHGKHTHLLQIACVVHRQELYNKRLFYAVG